MSKGMNEALERKLGVVQLASQIFNKKIEDLYVVNDSPKKDGSFVSITKECSEKFVAGCFLLAEAFDRHADNSVRPVREAKKEDAPTPLIGL